MKAKNYKEHLQKRLDKEEIKKLMLQAELESAAFKSLKQDISAVLMKHMQETGIGFNNLTEGLGISPTQVAKIKKGEANITFATVAHIAAFLGKKPQLIFK